MDKVDFVLVGSEAVVESGGLINAVGSNQMAIIARAENKPFYALAERSVVVGGAPLNVSLTAPFQLQIPSSLPSFSVRPTHAQSRDARVPAICPTARRRTRCKALALRVQEFDAFVIDRAIDPSNLSASRRDCRADDDCRSNIQES